MYVCKCVYICTHTQAHTHTHTHTHIYMSVCGYISCKFFWSKCFINVVMLPPLHHTGSCMTALHCTQLWKNIVRPRKLSSGTSAVLYSSLWPLQCVLLFDGIRPFTVMLIISINGNLRMSFIYLLVFQVCAYCLGGSDDDEQLMPYFRHCVT